MCERLLELMVFLLSYTATECSGNCKESRSSVYVFCSFQLSLYLRTYVLVLHVLPSIPLARLPFPYYRPVSVLPVVVKVVVEAVIHAQLWNQMLWFIWILSMPQHPRCASQDWWKALNRDEVVGTVLLDLSKASASKVVWLWCKRERIDVVWELSDRWKSRGWLLVGESQSGVTLGEEVPQGSILGPTVFANDLPTVVKQCTVNLYANDTTRNIKPTKLAI